VYPPIAAPRLYRLVANLDARAVLLEMPLGDTNWDVRAVYYSTAHWRQLVNGYSGFFPEGYEKLANALEDPDLDAGRASRALADSGATHVLVHGRAFRPAENEQIRRWLTSIGAQTVAIEEDDILYELPR
jgi:hypothetical protein